MDTSQPRASLQMQHPSAPGYYESPLSERAAAGLARLADVVIPPAEGFPDAGEIVPDFVSQRIDASERDTLEAALAGRGEDSPEQLEAWFGEVESNDQPLFLALRTWIYFGYYGSRGVVEALRLKGSEYHGAPQPFGYRIDRETRLPAEPRGTWTPTEDVSRLDFS